MVKGCKGNYPLLVKYGQKLPVFPDYPQRKSLIFIDNLCEFIRLLIDNNSKGFLSAEYRVRFHFCYGKCYSEI